MRRGLDRRGLWTAANVAALLPLLWTAWDMGRGNLIDPVDSFTARTGQAAIILLLLSLAVTPAVTLTDVRALVPLRKRSGLWAFAYAALHLLVFVGLDYAFSLELILKDGLQRKPYILVGAAALLILLPLAVTSTKRWMKRLGRRWKQLHRGVYAAGVLAVLHYLWVAKLSVGKPALYAAILAALLVARIPPVRSTLAAGGRRLRGALRALPALEGGPTVNRRDSDGHPANPSARLHSREVDGS